MKILDFDTEGAAVRFSVDELDGMRNGLNKARLLVSAADFQTRMGPTIEEVNTLIHDLQPLIGDIDDKGGNHLSNPQGSAKIESTR